MSISPLATLATKSRLQRLNLRDDLVTRVHERLAVPHTGEAAGGADLLP